MKKFFLFGILVFSVISPPTALSQTVLPTNSTGDNKTIFYTNETVYMKTTINVTSNSAEVRVYIVTHNDTWADQTPLIETPAGYRTITTNATGYIPVTSIWTSPIVGKYDIVVDTNKNSIYDTEIDFINNETVYWFEVKPVPTPTLNVSVGVQSPQNHTWDINLNGTQPDTMLQVKLSATDYESVKINTIYLSSSGTGDDKTDISMVRLIEDRNRNGLFDSDEVILSFGKYISDDSVLEMNIQGGYTINANTNSTLIVVYTMSNEILDGRTFEFEIASISAEGATSGKRAAINGLPIKSSTMTITGLPRTTTTVTTTTTTTEFATTTTTTLMTTTTTLTTTETTTTTTIQKGTFGNNYIKIIIIVIPAILILGFLIIKFVRKDEYELLKEK